MLQDFIFFL